MALLRKEDSYAADAGAFLVARHLIAQFMPVDPPKKKR